jgi:release factor glutamine methyltransferase
VAATVDDWLARARTEGVERLDAQLLLARHLGRPRSWLLAHGEAEVPPATRPGLAADLGRRAAGVPLAYLTGEREFRGLLLRVTPAVLVPRPETEVLVDWALALLGPQGSAEVVDLGTGSGAIALALKHQCPSIAVTATDLSIEALEVARANADRLGLAVEFVAGPWWSPLAGRRFELAVCNPPYVAGDDPHLKALGHEPRAALTPEGDGLAALRIVVAGAAAHLRAGGWLLLEHGHDQGAAVRAFLAAAGFEAVETRVDLAGRERASGGRRPRSAGATPPLDAHPQQVPTVADPYDSGGCTWGRTGASCELRRKLRAPMKSRLHARLIALALAALGGGAWGGSGLIAPQGDWLWPQVQVRITVQSAALSPLAGTSLAGAQGQATPYGIQSGALLGEVVLARPSYGIFRATSGVLLGQTAGAPLRDLALGDRIGVSLFEGVAGPQGQIATPITQPYVGLGYRSPEVWGGLSLSADLGFTAAGLGGVGRALAGQQAWDLALRDLRLAPLLQFGLRYSF